MIQQHIPVMAQQIIQLLCSHAGIFIDCTFGAGGHTKLILQQNSQNKVIAIDRDGNNLAFAQALQQHFGEGRLIFVHNTFDNLSKVLQEQGVQNVQGILYDIGVSSMQIDTPERGFSFQKDGPLDMRMGNSSITAADIVNLYPEREIANILFNYADERKSFAIAKNIIKHRQEKPITTTLELAKIVSDVFGKKYMPIHPATRTFQALRMAVNDELQQIESSLKQASQHLLLGGRIAVITFHSIEDAIVKKYFADISGKNKPQVNRHDITDYALTDSAITFFALVNKKPITPDANEIKENIRSRSAKLRVIEKTNQ
jgi:16S rRNA (cytosine1402-N4)-methyltransferase